MNDIPLDCTLDPTLQQARIEEFRALFARIRPERVAATHLRLTVPADAGVAADSVDSAEHLFRREQDCCAFFAVDVTRRGSGSVIDVRVPASRAGVLDGLVALVPEAADR